MSATRYWDKVREHIDLIDGDAVRDAARELASAISNDRVIRLFGASHAGILAEDLFYRAGGLVPLDPVMTGGLMLSERPIQRTSMLERLPGLGTILARTAGMQPEDVALVISISGRNAAAIEFAEECRELGVRTIGVTSLAYSRSVAARRGNRRLFEVVDRVLDIPGVPGDAAVDLSGHDAAVGPTSTAVGSALLQGLMVEVCSILLADGHQPPTFKSANTDGGDERNAELLGTYRGRITYS